MVQQNSISSFFPELKPMNPRKRPVFILLSLLVLFSFSMRLVGQNFALQVPDAEKGVYLKTVDVSVEILGQFALTTTEMVFHNPNLRQLEGTLEFPLLEGQTVVRFAMDMDGGLREAVPVEKEKGQQVFEAIERRRVDPGLLEKTQGNHYRARIFPIPGNSDKRVVIATLEDLSRNAARENPTYRLAMNYGRLDALNIEVCVKAVDQGPTVDVKGLGGLKFSNWSEDWVSEASASKLEANGVIEVRLPGAVKSNALSQVLNGKTYFYVPLELPEVNETVRVAPKLVTLLWDSSSSASAQDEQKIYSFLDGFFKTCGEVDVELIRVREKTDEPIQFKVHQSNWDDLKAEIEKTLYDGATTWDLGLSSASGDLTLLVTDGMVNWNPVDRITAKDTIVYCVLASTSADTARLRAIAGKNGGTLLNLMSTSVKDALEQISRRPISVKSIQYHPQQLSHLTISEGSVLEKHACGIAGILRTEQAELILELLLPNGEVTKQTIQIATPAIADTARQSTSTLAARIWAMKRIEGLEMNEDRNAEEIRRIGKEMCIVTKGTSLIILDSVEDYAQYGITPPEQLKAAYLAIVQQQVDSQLGDKRRHLDWVYSVWQEEMQWYLKDWPKGELPRTQEKKEKPELSGSEVAYDRAPRVAMMEVEAEGAASEEVYELSAFELADDGVGAQRSEAMPSLGMMPPPPPTTGSASVNQGAVSISLQPWKPDAAYIEQISQKEGEACYLSYLEFKHEYARSTAFYLDVFDILREKGLEIYAVRVLSNLAEMQLENHSILRILAYRLMQADYFDLARMTFEEVLRLRPEEPQSYRDLALVHAKLGNHQTAIEYFWDVVEKPWDERFPDIQIIALHELNGLLGSSVQALDFSFVESRFIQSVPMDFRVVLTWDADNTDIDLWVTDPNGETCIYNHPLTYQGGKMSRDFTRGYGPEVFSLKDAKPGTYRVEANYYGNSQQILSGSTTLQLSLQTHFGSFQQEEQMITLRLQETKEVVFVGEFKVE